jgi:hypothetical protein
MKMVFARNLTLACSAMSALALPAFAGVTVNAPASGTNVTAPFTLSASAATCSAKSVVSMGYSFDSSSSSTVFSSQSVNTTVPATTGAHTLHVKAWAGSGVVCVKDVAITVNAAPSGPESIIPSIADKVSSIEALSGWQATHDTGGPGTSSGSMTIVSSPSLYGSTRRFVTGFTNNGDERYSIVFADDANAKNFFYDTWIYLTSSSSMIANIEFDTNQVMSNGQTVLMGFQCDGYSGNWAYTVNQGTASNVKPHWVSKSGTTCNPRNWSQNKWHHVQASFTRDGAGYITYKSIWLDGVESKLNVVAYGCADLSWDPVINTQFQIDGLGSSGTVTAYLDNLTISAW